VVASNVAIHYFESNNQPVATTNQPDAAVRKAARASVFYF